MRKLVVLVALALALFGVQALRPATASAATCYVATGSAANVLCWLDMSAASTAVNTPTAISWTLPDGSVLKATVTNTGTVATAVAALPTYSGSALGNSAYTGVGGKPAFYSPGSGTYPMQLSGITLTDPQSNVLASTTIVGADAESLDSGDGTGADIVWTTAGSAWKQFQIMPVAGSTNTTPICTMSGIGTSTATCVESAGGNNAAYILSTSVSPSQSLSMSTTTTAKQGYAFAVNLATLALSKNVTSRINTTDEFTVSIARSSTTLASASTTGTTTGTGQATTTTQTVTPGDTYMMAETSSASNLASYSTTYSCTNANTGSSTVSPSGTGTSFTITPGPNDQFTCSFTNAALTSTATAVNATKSVPVNSSVTDSFTLKNTSSVPANFSGTAPTLTSSVNGTTVTASGYTYDGSTYTTYAALLAAIPTTAANGSVTVGVIFTTPATSGSTVTVTYKSDVTGGGGTSTVATATETDTLAAATLAITKTGTTQASPGGLVAYSILVSATALSSTGATMTDPVPAGLTISGTPTCSVTSGTATCPTITVSGNTVTADIATFPKNSSLTFTIHATAGTAASYTNTATLTPNATGTAIDSSLTTTVSQSNGISKTVQNLTSGTALGTSNIAAPGDTLQYTLSFSNTTGTTIQGISFSDPLPTYLNYVSATCVSYPSSITSCAPTTATAGSIVTVTFTYGGTLASGATLTATIRATVK